jgi:hypothetical protein
MIGRLNRALLSASVQTFLAIGLRLTGWLALNALVSFGVMVTVAGAIGDFSIEGAMHHLANLAGRYLAAGADRRDQFDICILTAFAGVFCATCVLRGPTLSKSVREDAGHG